MMGNMFQLARLSPHQLAALQRKFPKYGKNEQFRQYIQCADIESSGLKPAELRLCFIPAQFVLVVFLLVVLQPAGPAVAAGRPGAAQHGGGGGAE